MTTINNKSGNGGFINLMNDENKEIGRLTYSIIPEESKLIISYVMVYPEFEGKGYGKFLIETGIKFARDENLKIYPHCSYARAVMNRMNDIDDILLKS